jgi:hypothetical protein
MTRRMEDLMTGRLDDEETERREDEETGVMGRLGRQDEKKT